MRNVETVHEFRKIKLLADSRRLHILRLLMASPATLTQLAHRLGQSPAWISHHLRALQEASLVELVELRKVGRITEKYYRARAGALLLDELILPQTRTPAVVFSGSHDLALEGVAERCADRLLLLTLYVGSLDGLANLRQGLCQVSGAHLLDESGEYNASYVRRFFPDRNVELITLAHRTQGLLLGPGNPKSINGLRDLSRPGVRFINRNAGSGTRLWLERELSRNHPASDSIGGFDHVVATHTEVAALIRSGKADAGLGLQAAAHQAGLDFLPLFEERYDLVLPCDLLGRLAPILDYLQTARFRTAVNSLTGYSTTHSGEQILIQKGS